MQHEQEEDRQPNHRNPQKTRAKVAAEHDGSEMRKKVSSFQRVISVTSKQGPLITLRCHCCCHFLEYSAWLLIFLKGCTHQLRVKPSSASMSSSEPESKNEPSSHEESGEGKVEPSLESAPTSHEEKKDDGEGTDLKNSELKQDGDERSNQSSEAHANLKPSVRIQEQKENVSETTEKEQKGKKSVSIKQSSSASWESAQSECCESTPLEYHPSTLPLVSLSHGLNRKATPRALESWVALSLTLDGRDKITKVVQYASRLLAWWFGGGNGTAAHAQRFKALYTHVSKSRKAFRLGRSFVELAKLRQMGLVSVALWHLRLALNHDDATCDAASDTPAVNESSPQRPPFKRPHLPRKASSNIGWGPSTTPTESSRSRSLYRSLSNIGYRMYRPMVSQLSMLGPSSQPTKAPAWKIFGTALKLLGLLGFWAGDNVSFLNSTGFLDNYSLEESKRLAKRKTIQSKAVRLAFRSYFMGALAGLFVNIRAYWDYRQQEVKSTHERLELISSQCDQEDDARLERARRDVREVGEKQFVLFLAALKVSSVGHVFVGFSRISVVVSSHLYYSCVFFSFRAAVTCSFSATMLVLTFTRNIGARRCTKLSTVCVVWSVPPQFSTTTFLMLSE